MLTRGLSFDQTPKSQNKLYKNCMKDNKDNSRLELLEVKGLIYVIM